MRRSRMIPLALACIALTVAACQVGATTKAGGETPRTLRIGTDDHEDKPGAAQIRAFAREVERLSDGSMRIEPSWHAAGDGPEWDQRVSRLVVEGTLDLGLIPSRAFDTEGVSSLRALNTPFLVTSDEHLERVVTDDELAGRLMAGLEGIGLVGLTLLPEGLRHPFGLLEPLGGPADYAGAVIRSPASSTVRAMLEAFGATASDADFDAASQRGAESSYQWFPPGIATGNVTFFPKVNTLVMNAGEHRDLTDDQRRILGEAAAATLAWAIDNQPSDAEAGAAYCEAGFAIAHASEADVVALRAAAAGVAAEIEADPATKSLVEDIRALGDGLAPPVVAEPCGASAAASGSPVSAASPIDGQYRIEQSRELLEQLGVDPARVTVNAGVYTITFNGDEWCWDQKADSAANDSAWCGPLEVDEDSFVVSFPEGVRERYGWSKAPNGDLTLTIIDVKPADIGLAKAWVAVPWVRIGDVPSP